MDRKRNAGLVERDFKINLFARYVFMLFHFMERKGIIFLKVSHWILLDVILGLGWYFS
jgi:hypothetical protein